MEEKRPLRRQPEDHHFWSLIMLAVTAGAFLLGHLGSHEGAPVLPPRVSDPLKADWQRQVLASSGYLELGMFDDAALVLEEIEPQDKTRTGVLGARVNLYMAAKKWEMAAVVASHLVKVDPQTASWWISLAYALRRTESVEKAEAVLLRAQAIHPKVAMIAFNLACYTSVAGRMEEAKTRLRRAIELDKNIRRLALDDDDLKPLWDWHAGLDESDPFSRIEIEGEPCCYSRREGRCFAPVISRSNAQIRKKARYRACLIGRNESGRKLPRALNSSLVRSARRPTGKLAPSR